MVDIVPGLPVQASRNGYKYPLFAKRERISLVRANKARRGGLTSDELYERNFANVATMANELSEQTVSDVYIFIYRDPRYYSYRSTDREGWPALEQDIVSFITQFYPPKRDHYPPTVARRPDDFEKPNEEHVEAQKEEPEVFDQGSSEETLFERGRRVIFMPETPLLRLEPKRQASSKTSLA